MMYMQNDDHYMALVKPIYTGICKTSSQINLKIREGRKDNQYVKSMTLTKPVKYVSLSGVKPVHWQITGFDCLHDVR